MQTLTKVRVCEQARGRVGRRASMKNIEGIHIEGTQGSLREGLYEKGVSFNKQRGLQNVYAQERGSMKIF